MHSFLHGCSLVGKWNIKFGMGMCRFGMEHFMRERGTADWLVRRSRPFPSAGGEGSATPDYWLASCGGARACFGL